MATNNPTDDDAFAHLLDKVIQLPTNSAVRTFFNQAGINNLGDFALVFDYDDFYPSKLAGTNDLADMALMDQMIIKQIFAACELWRQQDPQNRDSGSFPPAGYWFDSNAWTHDLWKKFVFHPDTMSIIKDQNTKAKLKVTLGTSSTSTKASYTPLQRWELGAKRDKDKFPQLKDFSHWRTFSVAFRVEAENQDVSDALDSGYKASTTEDQELIAKKRVFLYGVLIDALKCDAAQTII